MSPMLNRWNDRFHARIRRPRRQFVQFHPTKPVPCPCGKVKAVLTAGSKAPIFDLTEEHAAVERAEMLELYNNMGIGFRAIADPAKSVHPPQHKPIGSVKRFAPA